MEAFEEFPRSGPNTFADTSPLSDDYLLNFCFTFSLFIFMAVLENTVATRAFSSCG